MDQYEMIRTGCRVYGQNSVIADGQFSVDISKRGRPETSEAHTPETSIETRGIMMMKERELPHGFKNGRRKR